MNEEKNNTKSWLDKLQQESWQLELIVSSILLLIIGSYDDKIPNLILKYKTTEEFNFSYVVAILIPILLFLKSNLIVHIFLRGLWIGCIGLRYISTDIDYNSFGYATKFDRFLKKKVLPFDNYIEKLERICSIIFSYSFLMVFHFLSFSIFFTIIQCLNYFAYRIFYDTIAEPFFFIILLVLLISGLLNFIDFLTIGKLKKSKYISTIFYPLYRLYNILSLAFLYRPIHYNFISNKLGRNYMLLMLPYMFFLAIAGNEMSFREYIYIPKKESGSNWIIEDHYDEFRKKTLIEDASIEKLFYDKNEPIKLFLRVDDNEKTNGLVKTICPEITSYEGYTYSIRPFHVFNIKITDKKHKRISSVAHKNKIESSLSCISQIYEVSIDSNRIQSLDYVFYEHPNFGEEGLLTGININDLESGRHTLTIKIKRLKKDKIGIGKTIEIPFFKN